MPSGRGGRPFTFTFLPCGPDEDTNSVPSVFKNKVIPMNTGTPVEVENAHFKGKVMLIHETGNEPGAEPGCAENAKKRGVELQIQGKFKHPITSGDQTTSGIWAGGELQEQLKLGWIMNNVVQLCAKFARKKTEGRLHFTMGGKAEKPHLSFPATQLFTYVATPPGSEPPKLCSEELRSLKWQGPTQLTIDPECTYTFTYNTPYLDLCSWELLKVPGVSPLPIESMLGDVSTARVILYDLGVAGSQANWRKGVLIEWVFVRGTQGDAWPEEEILAMSDGAKTPLEEASDASEEEEEGEVDDEDALIAVDDKEECVDSESSDESMVSDEEEELSRAESQALNDIEGWRPRQVSSSAVERSSVKVPYYIEAIDRRRRRKVRVWYVLSITNPDGADWWHAKAASELASLCRPRRRLQTFRRGPGARRYTCCAVKTLEQFRTVVSQHLATETKMRNVVMTAAATNDSVSPKEQLEEEVAPKDKNSPSHLTPAGLARKVRRRASRGPLLPPRFFVGIGSPACGLAFAHAREGRQSAVRETLVGVIHFEGRLCEELLRLSDGIIRCFTPYDCVIPRMRILATEVMTIECPEGLFLGRFHLWRVHTPLRVFSFCSADEKEREEWVTAIESSTAQSPATTVASPTAAAAALRESRTATDGWIKPDPVETPVRSRNRMITPSVTPRTRTAETLPPNIAALLTDSTRARRWRGNKRLVLNDRRILQDACPPLSSFAEGLLETVLGLGEDPATSDLTNFMDAACELKAVRFTGWKQDELLAFWLNVYHCLLLHGWLLLGTPKSKRELTRFYNRVSYLIGLRPVSLREIERVVLHVPKADPQAVHAQARARALQLLGFCGCCQRRRGFSRPKISPPRSPTGSDEDGSRSPTISRGENKRAAGACLPMPQLPRPWSFQASHACLFLGKLPESPSTSIPKQDLRAVMIANRGNKSCLGSIPIFHAQRLSSELNDICRQFASEFVEVQERDGRVMKANLPYVCQLIKHELAADQDPQALLKFVWNFMPEKQAKPSATTQIKFNKYQEDMRRRVEVIKAVYTDPNLTAPSLAKSGNEFEVINGTAQALALLPSKQSGAEEPAAPSEEPAAPRETRLRIEVDESEMTL